MLHHPALKGSPPFLSWSFTLKGLVAKRPTSSFSFNVRYFFHLHHREMWGGLVPA